ncbi:MAG: ABC transporter permease [Oscillospiraceae bacterium]|nr:ABC transporter permease [Oscillospiraceae bacterium]
MKAVYLRELRSYFTTVIGYLFIAAMTLLVGIYAYVLNFDQKYPTFEQTLYYIDFVYLLVIPILTMRAFAEEKRRGTMDLLYTLPLRPSGVVLGKYFALLTVLAIPCALFCLYPAILSRFGAVELATAYGAIFGFFLLGAALGAIGLFLGSLTGNQIAAAIVIFASLFLSYLMRDLVSYLPSDAYTSFLCFLILVLLFALAVYFLTKSGAFSAILAIVCEIALTALYFLKTVWFENAFPRMLDALAVFARFERFATGIFDLGAVVYFVSVSALFLFFTTLSVEKRRWS